MDANSFQSSVVSRTKIYDRSALLYSALLTKKSTDVEQYCIRALLPAEILTLEKECHCKCFPDWSGIFLMYERGESRHIDLRPYLRQQISHCTFFDRALLGVATRPEPPSEPQSEPNVPSGIHRNRVIRNSILEPRCRVYDNGIIDRSHIHENATVSQCESISQTDGGMKECVEMTIVVGAENGGGRPVAIRPESTLVDVCRALLSGNPEVPKPSMPPLNILESHCVVHDSKAQNVHFSPHSSVRCSPAIRSTLLLPHASVVSSSVSFTILQHHSSISSSNVTSTILMEHSSAGPASLISNSIIGPDSHLSAGEIHASVLGPNTAAHHQSLLISVISPLGRTNIGYGGNIGSNHTLRLPDRECWAGEGLFFGLGCNVTFPVNTLKGPYSVIASGAHVDANFNLKYPFSLVTTGGNVQPGWVVSYSPYTIERNGVKFIERQRAKRHGFYTENWKIYRRGVIQLCVDARRMLKEPTPTDRGGCVVSEKGRRRGISIYTDVIRRYALRGLLERLELVGMHEGILTEPDPIHQEQTEQPISFPVQLPWEEKSSKQQVWDYQLRLIQSEFPTGTTVPQLLTHLIQSEDDYSNSVYLSKKKDDDRGRDVIPLYDRGHVLAEDDPVVKRVQREALRVKHSAMALLAGDRAPLCRL